MTNRAVKVDLVAGTAGYDGPIVASSKVTADFEATQKGAAAAAKAAAAEAVAGAQAIAAAEKAAATAAKDAAATATAANKAVTTAQKEASAAAKEAAIAETASAKAVTDEEIASAAAAKEAAAQRMAAAEAGVGAAAKDAASATEAAASAKEFAASQRDVAAASKEAAASAKSSAKVLAEVAAQETADAKASAAAAAERADAYKKAGAAVTMMAAGFGLAAGVMVKSAGDFQSSTQHLVTDAGESQDKLAMVQAGILKTATATGTSATALVDAMYHIESAGFHGQAGLDMLTTAAQGAKVGAADLGTVAKTLTGTMNSYSTAGYTSTQMMNMLIATTAAGDMKMNDLAGSLGNVAPIAAAAGIKFSEVGGAIATMTSQNMSADRATQDLANTINALQKPNNVAIQQMQQLGLSSNDVSMNLGSRGLTGTLEVLTTAVANHTKDGQVFIDTLKNSTNAAADMNVMLTQLPASIQGISKKLMDGTITTSEYNKGISGLDASQLHLAKQFEGLAKTSGSFNDLLKSGKPEAETFNAALSNLLGGATGLNTALMLTGGRMDTFKNNTIAVQDAADKSGTSVDNWGKIQATFNQKMDVAKASIGAAGIAIGTTLLPAVAELAKWVTNIVTPIAAWVDKHQALTAIVLGSVAAVSALILMIAAAVKTAALIKTAVEGATTAVQFFTKSAGEAAVKTEAMAAANAAAAKESEVAAASTGGWAGKLGGAVPVIGAVIVGAAALGKKLGELTGVGDHTGQSITNLTNQLLDMNQGLPGSTQNMQGLAVQFALLGKTQHELSGSNPAAVQGMKDLDKSVAGLVSSGHADQAAASFGQMQAALQKAGFSIGYINDQLFPVYNKALGDTALASRETALSTDNSTKALGANTGAMDANATAALGAAGATTAADKANMAANKSAMDSASALYQAAAASRAQADAQAAESDKTFEAAVAHTGAKSATAAHSSVTKDATAATKASTAASKADAAAVKADDKAAIDHGKTVNDATAITKAGITATNNNAAATAAASQKKLADAAAATAQANAAAKAADKTAAHTAATNTNAAATSTAADKLKAHTAATDANAAAAVAAADKQKANTTAAKDSAAAHSTAAASKSADAAAARDQAKAVRDATTAIAASDRASAAATKAADAHTKATDAHAKATAAASKAANDDAAAQAAAAEAAKEAAQEHEFGTEALKAWAKAAADTSHSTDILATSVTDEVAAMRDAKDKANGLKDALDALNGVHIAAGKAALDVQAKVADLTKALHDNRDASAANGVQLDITTEKGRANMTQIYDLAAAINAHAQAVVDETGSVDAGNKSLDASRQEFDKVLTAAGLSKGQIDEFNKTLLNTPKLVPVTVTANTDPAMAALKAFRLQAGIPVAVPIAGVNSAIRQSLAAGGLIKGPGSETSDSIPIMASKNEFILNAAATRAIGIGNLTRLNAAHGQTGTIVRPQLVTSVGGTTPQAAASGGSPLHIEHYHESSSGGAQQTAADLAWLLHARGIAV